MWYPGYIRGTTCPTHIARRGPSINGSAAHHIVEKGGRRRRSGRGGEERASDGQALAELIGVVDDDGEDADDEPMAGPAMPSAHEMQAAYATLRTYPDAPGAHHHRQGDDAKEAGESDGDEPMAGPA